MNYVKTFNKQVACKPAKEEAQQVRRIAGMALIDEKLALTPLEVVFDSSGAFDAGDTVYVHGNNARNQPWWKAVFSLDGKEFILVPEEAILLVSAEE
jgi:hypothetical protein